MMPILQIGPVAVQFPGLILIAGIWLGLSLAEKHSSKFSLNANHLYNLVFTSLIAGIIGGRLLYIIHFPGAFISSPISIVSINPGLIDPLGGGVIALISTFVYIQRHKLSIWMLLDSLTPLFAVLFIFLSLSKLASGNGYGSITTLPWAIELWGDYRHPTQLYEVIFGIMILTFLWPSRFPTENHIPGSLFTLFLILTSTTRVFTEAFHGDSNIMPVLGLREEQVLFWMLLASSCFLYDYLLQKA